MKIPLAKSTHQMEKDKSRKISDPRGGFVSFDSNMLIQRTLLAQQFMNYDLFALLLLD